MTNVRQMSGEGVPGSAVFRGTVLVGSFCAFAFLDSARRGGGNPNSENRTTNAIGSTKSEENKKSLAS